MRLSAAKAFTQRFTHDQRLPTRNARAGGRDLLHPDTQARIDQIHATIGGAAITTTVRRTDWATSSRLLDDL